MKKLFLIPLLACFFCIGAYAITRVDVDSEASMREVLAAADSQDSTEITLTGDINFDDVAFVVPANAHVLLNLNGHSIESTYTLRGNAEMYQDAIFHILGLLHVISEGDGIIQKPVGAGEWESGSAVFSPDGGTLIIDGGLFKSGWCDAGADMGYPCYVQLPIFWSYHAPTIIINGGTFLTTTHSVMVPFGMFQKEGTAPTYAISGGIFSKSVREQLDSNHEETTSTYTNALVDYTDRTVYVVHPKFTEDADLTKSNSSTSVEVADNADVTLSAGEGGEEKEYAANFVYVEEGSKVTIETGATLVVEDKFVLEGENSQLEIQPGATLIVKNEVISANEASIAMTVNDKEQVYSNLLVAAGQIQASHPNATVNFAAKCHQLGGGKCIWQRFAVPSYQEYNYSEIVEKTGGYETAIFGWDYANKKWKRLEDGDKLEPFQCYNMTTNSTNQDASYIFSCELVGNGNPDLQIREGWNVFANAYTAPMNLKAWLTDLISTGAVDATIYIQKRQDLTDWQDFVFGDVITGTIPEEYKQLYPMQAFIYHGRANTTIPLKYKEYVYDPIVTPAALGAPAHRAPAMYEDLQYATISVKTAANHEDLLTVYQCSDFSEDFDNGFDAEKKLNEEMFSTYFATPLGNLARLATSELDSAAFSLKTLDLDPTEYTMSFKNVALEGYAILDKETNEKTEIKEGNEYAFTAEANTTYEDRFIIVEVGSHTAIDNVEATKKANGIYTLTGQYMGRDLNALPSGVYIFNGKKIVR